MGKQQTRPTWPRSSGYLIQTSESSFYCNTNYHLDSLWYITHIFYNKGWEVDGMWEQ